MSPVRSVISARALPAILVVAALARFGFSAGVVGLNAPIRGDEVDYHAIASHLAAGKEFAAVEGMPTARRPPAYPVMLSLLYRATGPSPAAARIVQILLGVGVVWLTFRAARAWFGATAAAWAGWLAALNPFLVFISGYLLTENLFLVLLLTATVLTPAPRAFGESSPRRVVLAGGLLGAAALARPSGLPLFEWMLAAVLLFAGAGWKVRAARGALAGAAFLLVLAPWLARNARVVGAPVLTTHGGITFYQGNNEKVATTPSWRGGVAPLEVLPGFDSLAVMPELARDRAAWDLGRAYLRAHPGEVPSLTAWKLARFWRVKSDMGLSGIRSGWWFDNRSALGRVASRLDAGMIYAAVALPLFTAGLFVTRRRWRELLFPYGVVVVHTAVAAVFFGSLRTRIPVEPVICVFAGAALAGLAARRRPQTT